MLKEQPIETQDKQEQKPDKEQKEKYLPVGIDPGKNICGVVLLHPDSGNDTVLSSMFMDNCSFEDADALIAESRPSGRERAEKVANSFGLKPIFVIEATNILWRPLFSYLKSKGCLVHTVCATQTKSSRGTKMRKTKTDLIDAKHIARIYKQGESHPTKFPEGIHMDLRELVRLHSFFTDMKGRILNRVYGYLFQVFPEFVSFFNSNSFLGTMWTLLKEGLVHPDCLQKVRIDKLTSILRKASMGRFKREKAIMLKEKAKNSFGISEGREGFSSCLKLLACMYEFVEKSIACLEEDKIKPIVDQIPNKLNTIKGLGIAQAYFLAESRKPEEYENVDDVVAWFGFDPRLSESAGKKKKNRHISKCGTKYGREAMFLSTDMVMIHNPTVMVKYRRLRKNGRTNREAKTIIAADLVKACYSMQRDNVPFNPSLIH